MKTSQFSWKPDLVRMLHSARKAAAISGQCSGAFKNKLLLEIATEITKQTKKLIRENQKDLRRAFKSGLSSAMIDRLTLNERRIQNIAEGVRAVAHLKDPIGKVLAKWRRPNGLKLQKVTVPLGVIFIIYESRPNVTVECAALCLKSSNAVILRGGREAYASNRAFVGIFQTVFKRHGLSTAWVNLVRTADYAAVDFLLQCEGQIDLVIPRGGEKLIRRVVQKSRIPVVKHYQGICHVYIDRSADLKKAVPITLNAKLQRPGVCNAMETLLVHKDVAAKFFLLAGPHLQREGCEVRGDRTTCRYLPWAKKASPCDFGHEFLDKIMAVKVVKSLEDAISHIETYGSHHTDAIVTEDRKAARIFKAKVDSSSVMVNASTRFSDGFEYGFGAEIGISTDKVHARGPMGLEGLTSYKYLVDGHGHVRT